MNKEPAGLPDWIVVFGRATGAAVVTTLFALIADVVILRILPVADAGRYALLISLAPMLAVLGGFGQAAVLKRRYSLRLRGDFNWSRDLAGSLLFSAPGLLLSVLAAVLVYWLSPGSVVFVSLAVPLLLFSQATAGVLDSHRLYVWARVLVRRYQGFVGLGFPLVLIGGLLLTEILPRAYMKGRAATSQLKRFALWQVGIALCGVVVVLVSSKSAGVVGATWPAWPSPCCGTWWLTYSTGH